MPEDDDGHGDAQLQKPGVGLNELLDRCIAESTKHRIDTCLIPRTLSLEPLKNVLLHAQRNGRLWRLRLEATANDAAHDVTDVSLRMLGGNRRCRFGLEPGPVSL
jgi:hypothetical protein